MPKPFEQFWDIAQENNVDDKLLSMPVVEKALDNLEDIGVELGETAAKIFKKAPVKPSGPTPDYQESAFIKPKTETTLYNVTTRENELPLVTKASRIFKNASYSVRGFSAAATYKKDDNAYSLIAGERVGFNFTKNAVNHHSGVTATYKVTNGKASLEYSSKNNLSSYNVSLFNQKSNVGVTAHYSNYKGFQSSVSIDKNSASGECSYKKDEKEYKMEVGAYATTGDNYSNPFVGVRGRITF